MDSVANFEELHLLCRDYKMANPALEKQVTHRPRFLRCDGRCQRAQRRLLIVTEVMWHSLNLPVSWSPGEPVCFSDFSQNHSDNNRVGSDISCGTLLQTGSLARPTRVLVS